MAAFIETGLSPSMLKDIDGMKTYLMKLNDDLRYMFNNLSPEDNFSPYGLSEYLELDEYSAEYEKGYDAFEVHFADSEKEINSGIEQTEDEINLYVSAGDVTNQLNISTDEILIQGQRWNVQTENFSLDTEGNLQFKGQVVAKGGKIGGFEIATDGNGRQYLKGTADSKLTAGVIMGAIGQFDEFICRKEIYMAGQTWYMFGCDIMSEGLKFTAGFATGDVDIARYSENSGEYTAWYPLNCRQTIHATSGCSVGKNGDDSGRVRCLSVYSYFEGEKPDPYGEDSSDRSLKENFREITGEEACRFMKLVRPVEYTMKDDDLNQLGFIAQEVEEAEQKAGRDFGIVSEDGDGYLGMQYMAFVPIMAAAVQEIDKWLYSRRARSGA